MATAMGKDHQAYLDALSALKTCTERASADPKFERFAPFDAEAPARGPQAPRTTMMAVPLWVESGHQGWTSPNRLSKVSASLSWV
jgi:hypothetical protein